MSTPHSEQLEQLMGQRQRRRHLAEIKETQRKQKEFCCAVNVPRGAVAVTTLRGGRLAGIEFSSAPARAWRRPSLQA